MGYEERFKEIVDEETNSAITRADQIINDLKETFIEAYFIGETAKLLYHGIVQCPHIRNKPRNTLSYCAKARFDPYHQSKFSECLSCNALVSHYDDIVKAVEETSGESYLDFAKRSAEESQLNLFKKSEDIESLEASELKHFVKHICSRCVNMWEGCMSSSYAKQCYDLWKVDRSRFVSGYMYPSVEGMCCDCQKNNCKMSDIDIEECFMRTPRQYMEACRERKVIVPGSERNIRKSIKLSNNTDSIIHLTEKEYEKRFGEDPWIPAWEDYFTDTTGTYILIKKNGFLYKVKTNDGFHRRKSTYTKKKKELFFMEGTFS